MGNSYGYFDIAMSTGSFSSSQTLNVDQATVGCDTLAPLGNAVFFMVVFHGIKNLENL